ncbi:hypothetical protein [Bacillus sp. MUM 13]|uniref:hypothetical protein n=1 Tax=Bacillus sp. MUM 13 TaxID=1678001 RepID=UPI0008F5BDAF|nr:hypothetical protein [Bacillus sp. MUM 13]OIK03628.1 hypothetical protein BIV59_22485 [Bacillus sp. MUM 13]
MPSEIVLLGTACPLRIHKVRNVKDKAIYTERSAWDFLILAAIHSVRKERASLIANIVNELSASPLQYHSKTEFNRSVKPQNANVTA